MTTDKDTLEWAARWIEDSLKGETNERVIEFGKNMAMTLRAAATPSTATAAELGDWVNAAAVAISEYLQAPPSTIGTIERLITRNDPSAVPVEEQSYEFAFDQRCYYCRNKCCHDAKAHIAAISEHG